MGQKQKNNRIISMLVKRTVVHSSRRCSIRDKSGYMVSGKKIFHCVGTSITLVISLVALKSQRILQLSLLYSVSFFSWKENELYSRSFALLYIYLYNFIRACGVGERCPSNISKSLVHANQWYILKVKLTSKWFPSPLDIFTAHT